MIISFSVFRDKLESGEKKQTIRPYSEFQYRRFYNAKKYQLYWHNPRNGGQLIKEVESAGRPIRVFFMEPRSDAHISILYASTIQDIDLCYEAFGSLSDMRGIIAKRDGFEDYFTMVRWFEETYKEKLLRPNEFMILRWK